MQQLQLEIEPGTSNPFSILITITLHIHYVIDQQNLVDIFFYIQMLLYQNSTFIQHFFSACILIIVDFILTFQLLSGVY